jgi:hypothetical protein
MVEYGKSSLDLVLSYLLTSSILSVMFSSTVCQNLAIGSLLLWGWRRWYPRDVLKFCYDCLSRFSIYGPTSSRKSGKSKMLKQMNQLSMLFSSIIIARVITNIDVHNSVNSSPRNIKCYWEQDEPPLSYFQGTEGTLEYERRKAVRF